MQAKLEAERVAKMASKSHRDRVNDFNQYLANLTVSCPFSLLYDSSLLHIAEQTLPAHIALPMTLRCRRAGAPRHSACGTWLSGIGRMLCAFCSEQGRSEFISWW